MRKVFTAAVVRRPLSCSRPSSLKIFPALSLKSCLRAIKIKKKKLIFVVCLGGRITSHNHKMNRKTKSMNEKHDKFVHVNILRKLESSDAWNSKYRTTSHNWRPFFWCFFLLVDVFTELSQNEWEDTNYLLLWVREWRKHWNTLKIRKKCYHQIFTVPDVRRKRYEIFLKHLNILSCELWDFHIRVSVTRSVCRCDRPKKILINYLDSVSHP